MKSSLLLKLLFPSLLPTARSLSIAALTRISFSEVPIDASGNPPEGSSIGERVKWGENILQVHDLATPDECQWLIDACLQAAKEATPTRELDKPGLVRLPTIAAAQRAAGTKTPCADPLPSNVDERLQELLERATRYMDDQLPSLTSTLFGCHDNNNDNDNNSLTQLLLHNQLKFSSREPAINVYTSGGEFLAHKDAQALTVLLPLSCPDRDFVGGGTAFWSQDARGHRVEDPTLIVKAPAGTALLFGGCVTHAGVAVESGSRVVFVASFSSSQQQNMGLEQQQPQRDIYGDSM
ncbi:expressed unknown protein [Seminavis robusta]|uniref:Prolyl 4-hydroxylase alpha subunit domain-containing protein n=1 Tax=Seminavis robusta TaxID=568900 RepID=A0A9N8E6C3_9STRA|nr:expressed unknown protein [Seminavis robusta]|eukprot:Sro719_g192400.1 n/a (294) ;mRNA; f:37588-38469